MKREDDTEPKGSVTSNQVSGRRGEQIAAHYLDSNGFRIVAKNYRCRLGEIDLIALKTRQLYFIEVKCRSNDCYGTPIDAFDWRKRQKMERAIALYLQQTKISYDEICLACIEVLTTGSEISIRFHEDS